MRFRFGNLISLENFPVGTDEDGNPRRALLVGAFGCPISQGHRAVVIAQQIGGQANLVAPGFQIIRRTEGNPQNNSVFVSIVMGSITEPVGLLGSIVAKGAGIEPDQDVLARVIREADVLPVLIGQGEGRRHTADCW